MFIMKATVKPYSGNKNPRKIKAFIKEILRISDGFDLNDSQLIKIAGRNMTGKASIWYFEHYKKKEESSDTFSQFSQELERQFCDRQFQEKHMMDLSQSERIEPFNNQFETWHLEHYKKKEESYDTFSEVTHEPERQSCEEYDRQFHAESLMNLRQNGRIDAFNNHFETILKELPADYYSEEAKLDMYLSHLNSNIKREVKCKNPMNLNSAMRAALLYEDQYNNSTYHKNKQTFKNLNPKENFSKTRGR